MPAAARSAQLPACSGQAEMIEVIDRIKPLLIVLMHYFVPSVLQRFLRRIGGRLALY